MPENLDCLAILLHAIVPSRKEINEVPKLPRMVYLWLLWKCSISSDKLWASFQISKRFFWNLRQWETIAIITMTIHSHQKVYHNVLCQRFSTLVSVATDYIIWKLSFYQGFVSMFCWLSELVRIIQTRAITHIGTHSGHISQITTRRCKYKKIENTRTFHISPDEQCYTGSIFSISRYRLIQALHSIATGIPWISVCSIFWQNFVLLFLIRCKMKMENESNCTHF